MRDGGRQIKSGKGDESQTKARVGEKIRGKVKKCNEGKETREEVAHVDWQKARKDIERRGKIGQKEPVKGLQGRKVNVWNECLMFESYLESDAGTFFVAHAFHLSLLTSLYPSQINLDYRRKHLTFLTSVLMTVTALNVVPFVAIFTAKCVHTIFFFKIIWLILSPGCKIPSSSIRPCKITLWCSVIEAKPWFFSIMAMLYENVFFAAFNISDSWVFVSTVP